jgi:hypothetical protein
LEELLEEDGLPCTAPSNKGQSRIPSKKACYHYTDQINPRPALKSLQKANKDLISISNQKRKGDLQFLCSNTRIPMKIYLNHIQNQFTV